MKYVLLVLLSFLLVGCSQYNDACEHFLEKAFYEKINDGYDCQDYRWASDHCIQLYELAYASCGEEPHTIMQKRGYEYNRL